MVTTRSVLWLFIACYNVRKFSFYEKKFGVKKKFCIRKNLKKKLKINFWFFQVNEYKFCQSHYCNTDNILVTSLLYLLGNIKIGRNIQVQKMTWVKNRYEVWKMNHQKTYLLFLPVTLLFFLLSFLIFPLHSTFHFNNEH